MIQNEKIMLRHTNAVSNSKSVAIMLRPTKRLKATAEGSTRLTYTGLRGGLKHLKIETRLIDID